MPFATNGIAPPENPSEPPGQQGLSQQEPLHFLAVLPLSLSFTVTEECSPHPPLRGPPRCNRRGRLHSEIRLRRVMFSASGK